MSPVTWINYIIAQRPSAIHSNYDIQSACVRLGKVGDPAICRSILESGIIIACAQVRNA